MLLTFGDVFFNGALHLGEAPFDWCLVSGCKNEGESVKLGLIPGNDNFANDDYAVIFREDKYCLPDVIFTKNTIRILQ